MPADASVVLLVHEPDIFAACLDPRIVLTLAGHTHAGQIRIMGWSPWIPSRYGRRYAYGYIVEGKRDLIVSAGLGSHFVADRPLRLGAPPEIVVVGLGFCLNLEQRKIKTAYTIQISKYCASKIHSKYRQNLINLTGVCFYSSY